ncbi:MAG: hypothetical protein ACT4PQ_04420 [Betaproteobacteria bacterium]
MIRYLLSARTCVRLLGVPAALWLAVTASIAADIAIISPRHEETLHDNSGDVTVMVRASLAGGQRIRLLLDGEPAGTDTDSTTIALEGIERGEHELKALVVDEKGSVLAASPPVTFYMWQASSQFPTRKKPAPPPKPPKN